VPKHAAIGSRVRPLAAALVASFVLLGRPDAATAQTPPPTESPEPSPSPSPEAPSPAPAPPSPTPTGSGDVGQADAAEEKEWSAKNGPSKSGARGPTRVRRPHRRPPQDDCAVLTGEVPYLGPAMDTASLQEILARARRFGFGPARAMRALGGPFPVAGPSSWSNDWHARRCEPYPHLHKGIDIFAAPGTPLVAVVSGRVTQIVSAAISGLSVEIADAGGTQYYYAHLSGFAPDLKVGEDVEMGDVLGYMGTTGNARGTSPHLHLEVQPGGVPVPPKPYVDRWLEISERRARSWIASLKDDGLPAPRPAHRPATAREAGAASGELGWPTTAAIHGRGEPTERWPSLIVLAAAVGGALGPGIRARRRRRGQQPTADPRPRRRKARRLRTRRRTPRPPKERRPKERRPKERRPKVRRPRQRRPKARRPKVHRPRPSRRRPVAWVPVTGLAGARPSTADPEPAAVRPPVR